MGDQPSIAVVIPCYRVGERIDAVLAAIPAMVSRIYCVDDACPEHCGDHIERTCRDPRVIVLRHDHNQGVGGAVITGYRQALADGAEVIVKIDGDGQMDPGLLPSFVTPILNGNCDYAKGNRFFRVQDVRAMPRRRLLGNAALSFLNKLSSGYWTIFDPTNGYTAVHAAVLAHLPLDDIDRGYFFETDMLFRLATLRCVVIDVPMVARYGGEVSSLRVRRVFFRFFVGHLRNFVKRVFYNYFLRDFSFASVLLVLGMLALLFGVGFGSAAWLASARSGVPATAGQVMIGALPIIVGLQMLLTALQYDIQNVPTRPIHTDLARQSSGLTDRTGGTAQS